jgi:SAM-dependent methyltransferase
MKFQEQRLFLAGHPDTLKSADPASVDVPVITRPVSLYEFGGDEDVVRKIQRSFTQFFAGASPVLDIGCGRGTFLEALATARIQGVGLDHSIEAVEVCKGKGFQVYEQSAHIFLGENQEKFGGIFCSHVIEHMGYDDATSLIGLCYAALRPGGVLLLITPNARDLSVISEIFWLDPTHVRPYPGALLRSMLQAVGFRIEREKYFLGDWRLIGRRNLPLYFLRRLLLGRYYGKPNTMILARKLGHGADSPALAK